jgi:hypothetical protein
MKPSLKQLSDLQHAYACSRTKMPTDYVVRTKYIDTTANGLTKCVIDWLIFNGHRADRISSAGRYIDESKIVTDIMGHRKKIGSGKYIKSQTSNGYADINATIFGFSVMIEVKMKDKMSEAQIKFAEAERKAGGQYWVSHNFDEFLTDYNSFIKNKSLNL